MRVPELNILYFGPLGLRGGIGGSARLRNMLNILEKLEAHTHLISYLPEKRYGIVRQRVNDYLSITTISVPSSLPRIFKLPALCLVLLYGLWHITRSDIVISHSSSTVYGLPALILAKIFNRPLLIDLTDSRDPSTPEWLYRFVLRHTDTVFCVSRYLEEVAREAGSPNVVHAPGFIDANAFQFSAPERTRIRKELSISNGEIAIGYAGAFMPDEGLPYLLRAFKNLTGQYDNIKLVLLGGRNAPGSDDIAGLVEELNIKEKVIIIPPQPYEVMPAYLSAFDIACSPKIDSLVNRCADPIKVYEYMAVGLPVVASSVSETTNVIESGKNGFLVKPEDADELAKTLAYVIQNLDTFQELRKKARQKVIGNYTQEVVLGKLETALSHLLAGKDKN